jgi:DNA modification methylase
MKSLGPFSLPGTHQGDCRELMKQLPDGCIQTCITSPPYWGLRDYGLGEDGVGLETTLDEHLTAIADVFSELKRVLRDDGTLWLNYGDRYNSSMTRPTFGDQAKENRGYDAHGSKQPQLKMHSKNLLGLPWRIAFALQADGWILRSDVIWAKPNPMPDSVTDRPTCAHEYLFLFSKRPKYFYDQDAVREEIENPGKPRPFAKKGNIDRRDTGRIYDPQTVSGRNRRTVWTITTQPTPEAHFATFPEKLVEPCILAGTSEKGCCADCGAPFVRAVERTINETYGSRAPRPAGDTMDRGQGFNRSRTYSGTVETETLGFPPSCDCAGPHAAPPSRPCIVFDPFMGSGTVGRVAEKHGRLWLGFEMNAEYIEIAKKRNDFPPPPTLLPHAPPLPHTVSLPESLQTMPRLR